LVIADYKDTKYLKKIEESVQKGYTVLLQDVGEEIDPTLDNVLNNSLIQAGKKFYVKFGEKEIEYNRKFKIYITTRMGNPVYPPEVTTKVAVVNFTVKESGLEEQCLGIIVRSEQPTLESSKNTVVEKIATGRQKIRELEDDILRRLSESKTSLLEDVDLIAAL